MADWNNPKNVSMSFDVKADENAVDFFNRLKKEIGDFEKAIDERTRQLFDELVSEGVEEKDEGYLFARALFMLGYQHGWNDHFDLTLEADKAEEINVKK